MSKHFLTTAAFGLFCVAITPAHADAQNYTFASVLVPDSLFGQTYSGSISFDDALLVSADGERLAVDNLAVAFDKGTDMDGMRTESYSHVPEPRSWMLILAGIGLVGVMVDRSKRRHI